MWIRVKEKLPPCEGNRELGFSLAYHTIYGIGVAWFWSHRDDNDGFVQELEEDCKSKYLCSCQFIKNRLDANYCIDDEADIDILESSPEFPNLGTVTHWMPLPEPPRE